MFAIGQIGEGGVRVGVFFPTWVKHKNDWSALLVKWCRQVCCEWAVGAVVKEPREVSS